MKYSTQVTNHLAAQQVKRVLQTQKVSDLSTLKDHEILRSEKFRTSLKDHKKYA